MKLLSVCLSTLLLAARRLWAHRRHAAGLLAGCIAAVAASGSIPAFTNGALQRVLASELAAAPGRQPAGVTIAHHENPRHPTRPAQFTAADQLLQSEGVRSIGLPVAPFVRYGALDQARGTPADPTRVNPDKERWFSLAFLSDLQSHATLTGGRWPGGKQADGSYEAVVEDATLDAQDCTVGAAFFVPLGSSATAPRVKVTVVGSFRRTNPADPYWFAGDSFDKQLFVPEDIWRSDLLAAPQAVPGEYDWYFGIDRQAIKITGAAPLLGRLYDLEAAVTQGLPDTQIFSGPLDLLTRYAQRAIDLQRMLLLLAVAPLAVVAYFLIVTTGLMVDGQRQELAVLRSRGGSLGQITGLYLAEGLLVALLAMLAGYPLAVLLARAVGAVAGFLQFVDRPQPPLLLSLDFWLYGAAAAALALIAYVLPALPAARQSIVGYKQESARRLQRPLWSRLGLDVGALALSGYAYYTLRQRPPAGGVASGASAAPTLEPLQIIAPVLFVMGAGLLCLRLLPLLLRLVARLTDRWSRATLYLTLVQLSRAPGSYTPVGLLLILTTRFGLYSATAARTLERSVADHINYLGGADAVLSEAWDSVPRADGSTNPDGSPVVELIPPPWQVHYGLPGVAHPARVRLQPITPAVGGKAGRKGTLLAIDPQDFGQVAWFRRDLAPVHINAYLNLLASDEEAVLVSTDFLNRNHLHPGDRISLSQESGEEVSLVIYGALSYWPGIDPSQGDFFIANLDFVEPYLGVQPYQVWLKLQDSGRLQPLIDALKAHAVAVVRAVDNRQALLAARRDPQLLGMLGGLTSGFLLAALITVLGFWLFAALSARARQLQFGVLRALGLSQAQLALAVVAEQVVAVGAGVAAGGGLGLAAARLFVPFLQSGSKTPPFRIATLAADGNRLYAVLLLMLLAGALGLVLALGRLRIHEAVKLGEDT